jgi:hypothetical protein
MDENPYQSPRSPGRAEPKPGAWHPLTWAVVGFAGGVVAAGPFVVMDLSPDLLIFGGIIGAILGLAYGIKRRW